MRVKFLVNGKRKGDEKKEGKNGERLGEGGGVIRRACIVIVHGSNEK